MDWEFVVAINVMALAFIALVMGLARLRQGGIPMLLVNAIVLVVGAIALYSDYAHSGMLVGGMFAVFVLLPGFLLQASNRAFVLGRYSVAARYVRLATLVHPVPQLWSRARVMAALGGDDLD